MIDRWVSVSVPVWTALSRAQEDENSLSKVSQSFREYSEGQGWLALVVGVVILVAILLVILLNLLATRRTSAPWRAFREFSDVNGLTPEETRLFESVAERVQPEDPVALFVKRSLFEGAAQEQQLDPAAVAAIREKVYGS